MPSLLNGLCPVQRISLTRRTSSLYACISLSTWAMLPHWYSVRTFQVPILVMRSDSTAYVYRVSVLNFYRVTVLFSCSYVGYFEVRRGPLKFDITMLHCRQLGQNTLSPFSEVAASYNHFRFSVPVFDNRK